MTVAEARPIIEENETERLMDEHDVLKEAIASVEVSTYVKSEKLSFRCYDTKYQIFYFC